MIEEFKSFLDADMAIYCYEFLSVYILPENPLTEEVVLLDAIP